MKKVFFPLVIIVLLMNHYISSAQSLTKRGGICFRVDDNPSLTKLHQFDSVFRKYQVNFCMAMTSWSFPVAPVYVDSLKSLIGKGHEVMDNTPTHQTQFFNVLNFADTLLYYNHPGVDHINNQKVCLRITGFDTTQSHNEGLIDITGNMVISRNPGEFGDLAGNPNFFAFYLSSPVNKICLWYDRKALIPTDPDTVYLRTLWDEPVSFGTQTGIAYHKLTQRNVIMHQNAVRLLGQRALKIFDEVGMPRPYTWIHPAGQMPWINGYDLKAFLGDSLLQYTQGSNYIYYSYLSYKELNPGGYAQFGMQSLDLSTETQSFAYSRKTIANAIAKHYVKIDASRFSNPVGGWNSFLSRTDSLLSWCALNNIPVRTYNQWSHLLYDSIPNKIADIFPPLNADLDHDGYPDGYDPDGMHSIYDTTDGVGWSGNRSFAINGNGSICAVNGLAGLEQGQNKFTIYTKGSKQVGSEVTVNFYFPETGQTESYNVSSETANWTEQVKLVNIPTGVSMANIQINHQFAGSDTVKISGMGLRSAAFLNKSIQPPQIHTANEPFTPVNLSDLLIDGLYDPQTINWTIHGGSSLNYSIAPGSILKVQKKSSFWVGQDSIYVVALAPDGIRDSCFMSFISNEIPYACSGASIQLTLLDTLDNAIIQWTSQPYDPTINNPNIYNPVVSPTTTTTYIVTVINPLGPINKDTVVVVRNPFPVPIVTKDTSVCAGLPVTLTASGGATYLWSTGETHDSIIVNPDRTTTYTVTLTSEFGCSSGATILLTRVEKSVIYLSGLWPAYCANDPSATVFAQPAGGDLYGSVGLIKDIFYPGLAIPGLNKIFYAYTNKYGCNSVDSLSVVVVALPVIKPQPDTSICAGNSIALHAGSGFDNYLWSNGRTDSVVVVDSVGHGPGPYEIWVYVTKDGCADKDTARINFTICPIGFNDKELAGLFSVYPNPASDEIVISNLNSQTSDACFELRNMKGDKVAEGLIHARETRISIAALANGIYLLNIKWQGKIYNLRLVKTG